jgi:hypothetical protein
MQQFNIGVALIRCVTANAARHSPATRFATLSSRAGA